MPSHVLYVNDTMLFTRGNQRSLHSITDLLDNYAEVSRTGNQQKLTTVYDDMSWQVGDGTKINIWLDSWLSKQIVSLISIPESIHSKFSSKVSDFIQNEGKPKPTPIINELI